MLIELWARYGSGLPDWASGESRGLRHLVTAVCQHTSFAAQAYLDQTC